MIKEIKFVLYDKHKNPNEISTFRPMFRAHKQLKICLKELLYHVYIPNNTKEIWIRLYAKPAINRIRIDHPGKKYNENLYSDYPIFYYIDGIHRKFFHNTGIYLYKIFQKSGKNVLYAEIVY